MKATLILCALASCAFADTVIQPRVTSEDLVKRQQGNPVQTVEAPPKGEVKKASSPEELSIVKQSTILSDGRNWTLVPRGAVICLPAAVKSKVDVKPTGTLLPWADFLARNYSWITTNEVSFDQAAGAAALPPERVAFWAKQDKVVVAVHQGGPISVRVAPPATTTITQR
jgi:hypothetical protein